MSLRLGHGQENVNDPRNSEVNKSWQGRRHVGKGRDEWFPVGSVEQ